MQRQHGKKKKDPSLVNPGRRFSFEGSQITPDGLIHLLWTATTRAAARNNPRRAARSLCLLGSEAGIFLYSSLPVQRPHRSYHILFLGQIPVKRAGGLFTLRRTIAHRDGSHFSIPQRFPQWWPWTGSCRSYCNTPGERSGSAAGSSPADGTQSRGGGAGAEPGLGEGGWVQLSRPRDGKIQRKQHN